MSTPHIHTCPACDRDHFCYGMGCTMIDCICDECADADDDDFPEAPDVDDSVKCCPDCERPNQFGELCSSCTADRDAQDYENAHSSSDGPA